MLQESVRQSINFVFKESEGRGRWAWVLGGLARLLLGGWATVGRLGGLGWMVVGWAGSGKEAIEGKLWQEQGLSKAREELGGLGGGGNAPVRCLASFSPCWPALPKGQKWVIWGFEWTDEWFRRSVVIQLRYSRIVININFPNGHYHKIDALIAN